MRAAVSLLLVLALVIALAGCGDPDVKTGTYVGMGVTFRTDDGDLQGYTVELSDGSKIIVFSGEPPSDEGAKVKIRKLEEGGWEFVPED